MVAFCQVSSKAGSKQADGRPLAGSGERVPVAALEPRFGAGGRAGQPDPTSGPTRRGGGQGGRKQRRRETSFAPYGGSVNPAPQPAAATAPAACGWAGSHAETRAGVRGGRGRGGAAPSPEQQRPPHKGGGAAGGRVEGPAAEQWAGVWQSAGFQLAQPPQLPLPRPSSLPPGPPPSPPAG
ncbi:atherin-like isoform X2 [Orcinus orca]|uniref:atherin-like isoform X1 n=1 Tax=Orcinus orca TaxID=9733 RepID=UPI00211347FE|nr:atherin-like isoform X1 [Orcinus orca]XP_049563470.1 atherin-like isoform X2 [Orcinus orca]